MKILAWGLLIAILLCALFVWPTLYHVEKVRFGYSEILIKTNRLTGESWRLTPTGGWTSINSDTNRRRGSNTPISASELDRKPGSEVPTPPTVDTRLSSDTELSPAEIGALSGTVHVNYRANEISVELYNGNDNIAVHELVVEAPTGYGSNGWERYRRFRLSGVVCPPYETRKFVQQTLDLRTDGRFPIERGLVKIVAAKGRR